MPEDIKDRIMAFAWPPFQPVTLLSVPRAASRSWGFIDLIWPVDKPVLSLPREVMVVASIWSPKLAAKAAEIYKEGKRKIFVGCRYIFVLKFMLSRSTRTGFLCSNEDVIPHQDKYVWQPKTAVQCFSLYLLYVCFCVFLTCGSRSVQRVVRLCRTIILSFASNWLNARPGATHRHNSGRLQREREESVTRKQYSIVHVCSDVCVNIIIDLDSQ